jgi:hypothetical protein
MIGLIVKCNSSFVGSSSGINGDKDEDDGKIISVI